ncbi:ParB/RepB/Spo0J family partition protein [Paenochrobactrum pullorum]|uniref:ParB/RepB/Spo0J family partition protein n=1 Tax=Paenochrobactrum pullorum TaxID=1324351 RepID=UPI0035BC419E
MNRRPFDIEDIYIGSRNRQPDMKKVLEIANSIAEIGLMNAPAVCIRNNVTMPDGELVDRAPILIYGRHRLLAMQALGHAVVECVVYDVDDLHAELMEIDENLARSELSPAEEAAHIRRRQEIWEDIHGSAKAIGARAANASMGRGTDANEKSAFASETAQASGRSLRSIQVSAKRGRDLGPDINRIINTSLDKGVEMDALISLPEEDRESIICRAEAGEKVSARPQNKPAGKTIDDEEQAFWRYWASISIEAKRRILPQLGDISTKFAG